MKEYEELSPAKERRNDDRYSQRHPKSDVEGIAERVRRSLMHRITPFLSLQKDRLGYQFWRMLYTPLSL
jgi:hypothetical protein